MDHRERALEIIRQAENSLRELVAGAAQSGDYESVAEINHWAREIGHLPAGAQGEPAMPRGASKVPVPGLTARLQRPTTRRRKKRSKSSPAGYPKFYRHGDELVKIGWSKREGDEYIHKAPRQVLESLVSVIVKIGERGQMFDTEAILPIADPVGKNEIPAYQSYLCLAWLRHEGLIEQRGRQGYVIADPSRFGVDSTRAFDRLTRR
jgi:hypothetical protein